MHKQGIFRSEQGATLIFVGFIFMTLMAVAGIVVDMGRVYAVQAKAQNASDAALMGAVATVSTTDLETELNSLFDANYPKNYLGSVNGPIKVTKVETTNPDGSTIIIYTAVFPVTVSPVIMQLFGQSPNTFNITSQVTGGFTRQSLELAMVLDNTGSMCIPSCAKLEGLKQASKDLVEILFGTGVMTSPYIHVSVIPYDTGVNIGAARAAWIQAPFVAPFTAPSPNVRLGHASNRNFDSPRSAHDDITDDLPTTEELKFRTPRGDVCYANCGTASPRTIPDRTQAVLAPMSFGLNDVSQLNASFDGLKEAGHTRINVGLMWGWFTLSPKWQGQWDPGKPGLPETPRANLTKAVVLMTDGDNTVYGGQLANISDDDKTTGELCEAMKAQGITIYTVGFAPTRAGVNEPLLIACASQPTYYFYAPDPAALKTSFKKIGDIIKQSTLRLSQ